MRRTLPRDANDVQLHLVESDSDEIEPTTVLDLKELKGDPVALKLSSVVFAIEGGCTVYLWWDDEMGDTLLLPLEGRGALNFDPYGGLENPRHEGWTGCVQLSTHHTTPGRKSFFLGLEFAKLRA